MTPYYLLIILPATVWLFSQKYQIASSDRILLQKKRGGIGTFMLIFLIMLMLRGILCGADTPSYIRIFNEYNNYSLLELLVNYENEYGYKVLNKLIGLSTDNAQWVFVITSLMCVLPLWYFYKNESENPMLTIALFLTVAPFTMYFSGVRQAIAMGLGVVCWYVSKRKRLVWFILLVLLAMQFHTSAFMLFFMYPIYHARITKKWLWFVVPCIIMVYVFRAPIFNFLVEFLWDEYVVASDLDAFMILILLVIFAVYSYIIPNEDELDQDTIALRNFLLFSIVLQCFAPVHTLSMRMNYYYLIFVPILIPRIIIRSKLTYRMVAKFSAIVMCVYFVYYFVNKANTGSDPLSIYPYVPFWRN